MRFRVESTLFRQTFLWIPNYRQAFIRMLILPLLPDRIQGFFTFRMYPTRFQFRQGKQHKAAIRQFWVGNS